MIISQEVLYHPAFNVVGIQVRTNNNEAVTTVPTLWQQWHNNNYFQLIPNKHDNAYYYGVYTDYASDEYGDYTLIASAAVNNLDDVPIGMIGRYIPAGSYVKLCISGVVPVCIIEAWHYVWSSEFPYQRSFTYDFERYPIKTYSNEHIAELYIAIK